MYGLSSGICVDNGTRNHIIQLAFNSIGVFMADDEGLLDSVHLIITPRVIIKMGRSFMWVGRNIVVEEIGLIQVIIAPAVIAIVANRSIGFIIANSSLIDIIGDECGGAHMVTRLKRTE